MFWVMFLGGGVSFFACLFLPAWLENRALRQEYDAARERIAELEEELTRVARQIEHHQSDPAYLERLARKEFGTHTPGVEIIPVETATSVPTSAPSAAARGDEELAQALEQATRTNPVVAVFVLEQTRPVVMGMSGVLMVVAVVLLVRGGSAAAGRGRE